MANQQPNPLVTINKLIWLAGIISICGTVVWLTLFLTGFWEGAKAPIGTVKDVGRAVVGMEQPRKEGVPPAEADARDIAAAAAIDCEGESVTLIGKCWREVTRITVRAKKRLPHLSYRKIVAKALTWVPDNWEYPRRWRDRDTVITEMGRSETVKDLIPLVTAWMQDDSDEGCAAKIVRAGTHLFGIAGGELDAVGIIRTYPKDKRFEDRGFNTDFRCMPN